MQGMSVCTAQDTWPWISVLISGPEARPQTLWKDGMDTVYTELANSLPVCSVFSLIPHKPRYPSTCGGIILPGPLPGGTLVQKQPLPCSLPALFNHKRADLGLGQLSPFTNNQQTVQCYLPLVCSSVDSALASLPWSCPSAQGCQCTTDKHRRSRK